VTDEKNRFGARLVGNLSSRLESRSPPTMSFRHVRTFCLYRNKVYIACTKYSIYSVQNIVYIFVVCVCVRVCVCVCVCLFVCMCVCVCVCVCLD